MRRLGDATRSYLDALQRKLAAGQLGNDEAAARYEAERAADAARQARAERERQVAKLSARHVADARRVLSGELPKSQIWRRLSAALRRAPEASVVLCGNTGAGKTTAATGYALTRVQAGWSVLAVSASRFVSIARYEEAREEAEQVDLLLVDEIHRVAGLPDWIATAFAGAIDRRYELRRQTLGMGTVPLKAESGQVDLEKALGREIVERFDVALATDEESYRRRG